MESKAWLCSGNKRHVLGQVRRNGRGIRQVQLYRMAVDLDADEPAEVDVITVLEGAAYDVRCSICGSIRTWAPGEEAIRRLLKSYGLELVADGKGVAALGERSDG